MKKLIVIMGLLLVVLAGSTAQEADSEYEALGWQAGERLAAEEYGEAIPLLERMHELEPGELGLADLLGGLYYTMGDYTKAEPYYLEAKAIREKALGRGHPDYAVSVGNIFSLYQNMEDYTQATMYYGRK